MTGVADFNGASSLAPPEESPSEQIKAPDLVFGPWPFYLHPLVQALVDSLRWWGINVTLCKDGNPFLPVDRSGLKPRERFLIEWLEKSGVPVSLEPVTQRCEKSAPSSERKGPEYGNE